MAETAKDLSDEQINSLYKAFTDEGYSPAESHAEIEKYRASLKPKEEDKSTNAITEDQSTWPKVQNDYYKPAMLVGAGAVGAKAIESIGKRMFSKEEPKETKVEPTLEPETAHVGTTAGKVFEKAQGPVTSVQEAEMIGNSMGLPNARKPNLTVVPQTPVQPVNNPVADLQAVAPPAPQPTVQEVAQEVVPEAPIPQNASPEEAQTIASVQKAAETPKETVKPLRTGSGMPAIQGTAPPGTKLKKSFEGPHEIPSTHAFIPGGQYMDIVRNGVGQDAFTASLKNFGGYPETTEQAYQMARSINESQSRLPRDVAKELNIGLGEPVKAITQKVGGNKTVSLKTPLAALGAIIAMTDLANARTPAQRREAFRNAGESFLPPGATPLEAGAPVLPPSILEAQRQATLLGSPYHKFK